MALASYRTSLYVGGVSTIFSDLATQKLDSTEDYQIIDATKRVIDLDSNLVVKSNDKTVDSGFFVDYLNGIIRFQSSPTGSVAVSGKYFPLQRITGAYSHKLTISSLLLDNTEFGVSGYRTRQSGLIDINLSLSRYDDLDKRYKNIIWDRKRVMIDLSLDATSIKGWYVAENSNNSGDASSLENEELVFHLAGNDLSNFSWRNV